MQVLMSWDAYSCMDPLSGCAILKEDVEEALQGKEGRIDELKKNVTSFSANPSMYKLENQTKMAKTANKPGNKVPKCWCDFHKYRILLAISVIGHRAPEALLVCLLY